jgi:hypothetical protein
MAAIPLPERGQPLDVNYIYDIANQINNLTNTVAVRATATSRVNTSSDTTGNLKFYAETKPLTVISATANGTESFFFTYPAFKFPPVVVITVINNSGSNAGNDVRYTLKKEATTTRAEGVVRFGSAGQVDLSISLIAIGIAT